MKNKILNEDSINEAAHEHFKKGQLGLEKAADTEHAFKSGANWCKEYYEELVKDLIIENQGLKLFKDKHDETLRTNS